MPLERLAELRQWVRLFREQPDKRRLWAFDFAHWRDVGICLDEIDRLVARVIHLTPQPVVETSEDTIAILPPDPQVLATPATTLEAVQAPPRHHDVDTGWNAALVAAEKGVAQAFSAAYRGNVGPIEMRTLALAALRRLHREPGA